MFEFGGGGNSTDEVATILGLSLETVRVYVKRAMRKLGATSRHHAKRLRSHVGITCSNSDSESNGAPAARVAEATTSKRAIIGSP